MSSIANVSVCTIEPTLENRVSWTTGAAEFEGSTLEKQAEQLTEAHIAEFRACAAGLRRVEIIGKYKDESVLRASSFFPKAPRRRDSG